jgi:hypothetical protein
MLWLVVFTAFCWANIPLFAILNVLNIPDIPSLPLGGFDLG